ncbi:MAG: hypothetical protein GX049_11730 [Alcaligenaceae bacterium]|nr:hypothetical protein [Alcaligenaceae bacterium]
MQTLVWLFLLSAFLPFFAALAAKAGGKGFTNEEPRPWLAQLQGWRARANAAQANTFEALPFFYAAVLMALYNKTDPADLVFLMVAWIVVRTVYIAVYISGHGLVRSLVWTLALGINIAILFSIP